MTDDKMPPWVDRAAQAIGYTIGLTLGAASVVALLWVLWALFVVVALDG